MEQSPFEDILRHASTALLSSALDCSENAAVVVVVVMSVEVMGCVRDISSRSGIGRRDTCWGDCVVVDAGMVVVVVVVVVSVEVMAGVRDAYWREGVVPDLHTVRDIDPGEPSNISILLAVERTQAALQRLRLNDTAFENISSMLRTLDKSHFEMRPLNDVARANIMFMFSTLETSHFDMPVLKASAP